MHDTQDLILAELRELRQDYNNHARETGERLSKLEAQMHALCGNGQPGRLKLLEDQVDSLKAWRYRMLGLCAGISGAISVIWELFKH